MCVHVYTEPTTGLDSSAAYSIVSYLVQVAKATKVAVLLTIHQPSAMVFEMLDDLLLLADGKVVYNGSIASASSYFTSVGYTNPEGINPADYFLSVAQGAPETKLHAGGDSALVPSWPDLFKNSSHYELFQARLEATLQAQEMQSPTQQPSSVSRFVYLLRHFLAYDLMARGLYVYRLIALIFIAVFIGTLFLNLQPTTDKITLYVGSMFFSTLSCCITAVSATSIFAKDRYEAVDRVNNGIYTPGAFVLAQFLAAAFYNLAVTFVFISVFHWLTNVNPNKECYVYDIFINWSCMMLTESFLLVVLEVVKNDFLTCTSGMLFIGMNMSFAGFFRRINDIPIWIRWMCYIAPLRVRLYACLLDM